MYTELKDFPSFGWVKKLNETRRFSGSVGTGATGMLTVHTFHYSVWTKEEKDENGAEKKLLYVSCYVNPPLDSGQAVFGTEEAAYEFSEENLEKAKIWLLQQLNSYDCIGC